MIVVTVRKIYESKVILDLKDSSNEDAVRKEIAQLTNDDFQDTDSYCETEVIEINEANDDFKDITGNIQPSLNISL
jgi:chromosome condensin MukBEF complex kleisin-like MukF subunit